MRDDTKRQQVAGRILHILRPLMRIVAAEVRSTEQVEPAQFGTLFKLKQGPCNLSELARRQKVSLPTMSKSISTLDERGWITRLPSEKDRRVVMVGLTELGEQILEDVQSCTQKRMAKMLDGLSPNDLDRLAAGVEILERVLSEAEPVAA